MDETPRRRSPYKEPYYVQIANVLRARIMSYKDDGKPLVLESEYELCKIHGVSRITIRKMLDILQHEGLIERTRRRGTLVILDAVQRYKRSRPGLNIHVMTAWNGVTDRVHAYYGQIYQGILLAAERAGYLVNIQCLNVDQTSMPRAVVRPPDSSATLGIISLGLMHEPLIQIFTQTGLPVVCADYWTENPQADAVVVDCFDEGMKAAKFLIRHGHTHLFCLGHRQKGGDKEVDAEIFCAGMQRALELAGLGPTGPDRIRYCHSGKHEDFGQLIDWFSALEPRPTAGAVFDSQTCRGLLRALELRGVHCPQDLSLLTKTFEGEPVDFSCLRSNPRAMGEIAVNCILNRATGQVTVPVRVAVTSRLELGKTVTSLGARTPGETPGLAHGSIGSI